MSLAITGFYASLLGIILIILAINVIRLRFKYTVPLGDGGVKGLNKAIRVHGNFTETIPLCLLLMAFFEASHPHSIWLHIAGVTLLFSRFSHAWGLKTTTGTSIYRQFAMMAVFIVILAFSIANIITFLNV